MNAAAARIPAAPAERERPVMAVREHEGQRGRAKAQGRQAGPGFESRKQGMKIAWLQEKSRVMLLFEIIELLLKTQDDIKCIFNLLNWARICNHQMGKQL